MIFLPVIDPTFSTYNHIRRVAATRETVIVDPAAEWGDRGAENGDRHGSPHGGAG